MYMSITDKYFTAHAGVPSLEDMQTIVGGWITTALTMPSNHRAGVSVDVFCNDEGLLVGLPINWARGTDMSPLAGNLVITASDSNGETIDVIDGEVRDIFEHLVPVATVTDYNV
jgi:hypothetical protein